MKKGLEKMKAYRIYLHNTPVYCTDENLAAAFAAFSRHDYDEVEVIIDDFQECSRYVISMTCGKHRLFLCSMKEAELFESVSKYNIDDWFHSTVREI